MLLCRACQFLQTTPESKNQAMLPAVASAKTRQTATTTRCGNRKKRARRRQGATTAPPPPNQNNAPAAPAALATAIISRFSKPINAQLDGGSLNLANRTLTDASGQTVEATKPLFWPNAMPVVAGSADDRRSGNIGIGAGSETGFGVNADTLGRLVRIASDSSNFSFDHGNAIPGRGRSCQPANRGGQQMPVVWGAGSICRTNSSC